MLGNRLRKKKNQREHVSVVSSHQCTVPPQACVNNRNQSARHALTAAVVRFYYEMQRSKQPYYIPEGRWLWVQLNYLTSNVKPQTGTHPPFGGSWVSSLGVLEGNTHSGEARMSNSFQWLIKSQQHGCYQLHQIFYERKVPEWKQFWYLVACDMEHALSMSLSH